MPRTPVTRDTAEVAPSFRRRAPESASLHTWPRNPLGPALAGKPKRPKSSWRGVTRRPLAGQSSRGLRLAGNQKFQHVDMLLSRSRNLVIIIMNINCCYHYHYILLTAVIIIVIIMIIIIYLIIDCC